MKGRECAISVLFLIAFGVYLYGAYPTVSCGDSGEFISASHTLGIPHAPGFPAYTLLAKTFQKAIPWGNIGYRTNLFSAFCGALAVVGVFALARRLAVSFPIALGAAVLFMMGTAQRVNAQASEVFGLHGLLCAGILAAALWDKWLLVTFLTGWGLGNHQTVLFLLPALGLAYFSKPSHERAPLGALILSGLAGLSIYAFLLMRAKGSPVMNSGDPDTWPRFWRVLIRADYGTLTLALGETPARTLQASAQHVLRFVHGLNHQVTWTGIGLGMAAIFFAIKQRSVHAAMLFAGFLALGPGFFLLGNLPFNAQSIGVLERFYIAPVICWVLLAAWAAQSLLARRPWIAAALFLGSALWAGKEAAAAAFRGDFRAYAYGRNNFRTLPPQTRFIMDGGDDTFYTVSYLQRVEGRRKDVTAFDRGGVVFPGFYGSDFRSLTRQEKDSRRQQVERATLPGQSPVYYSTMNEKILPDVPLVQEGILYNAKSHERRSSPWPLYDLRGIAPWTAPSLARIIDYRTRALVPFYAYQRSVESGTQAHWEEALGFALSAHAIGSDVHWLIPNLVYNTYVWGQAQFQSGQMATAERVYRLTVLWDPRASAAWSNLGAIAERNQRLDEAVSYYQKAIELDPASESAHYNLAVVYWKKSDWPRVINTLQRVLAINPNNPSARNYLRQAQARQGPSQ